jgi:hypothetical protein
MGILILALLYFLHYSSVTILLSINPFNMKAIGNSIITVPIDDDDSVYYKRFMLEHRWDGKLFICNLIPEHKHVV